MVMAEARIVVARSRWRTTDARGVGRSRPTQVSSGQGLVSYKARRCAVGAFVVIIFKGVLSLHHPSVCGRWMHISINKELFFYGVSSLQAGEFALMPRLQTAETAVCAFLVLLQWLLAPRSSRFYHVSTFQLVDALIFTALLFRSSKSPSFCRTYHWISFAMRHSINGWHEKGCRRPDVVLSSDNTPTCHNCGSIYTHADDEGIHRGELSIAEAKFNSSSTGTKLHLNWPSTIAFSSPADVEDEDIREALNRLQITKDESRKPWPDKRRMEDNSEDPPGMTSTTLPEPERKFESNEDGEVMAALYHSRMYQPLNGQDEIRLLHLSPSSSGDGQVLHGVLAPSHLSKRPEFIALSYTWADASGDRSRCETIFIGSKWEPLPITSNCAAALRRLRSPAHACVIWVDSICIDQDNTGERGHQVGLMRDIYSRAQKVVIFLGEEDQERGMEQSADGRLMARMAEAYFYNGGAMQVDWHPQRDYFAVQALFDRPYWRRIWVIQEVLLAKEAFVVLGRSSVPLACILRGRMIGRDTTSMFPSWTQLSGASAAGDAVKFSKLLAKTCHCEAADRRDKVFALLGLVEGAHLEGLVADYTKTSEDIYTGIAAYFLIRHGQTNILRWGSSLGESLSWVPTWGRVLGDEERTLCEATHNYRSRQGGRYLEAMFDWTHEILPNDRCRASGSGPRPAADVLDILRPRVCQGTGALLIRVYPVLHLNITTQSMVFIEHETADGTFLLKPSTRHDAPRSGVQWGVFGVTGKVPFDLLEDWIVEVPNCDRFLHLEPHPLVPGLYRIASACEMALVADTNLHQTSRFRCSEGHPFNQDVLLLRLLMFEPHHLLFLQSCEEFLDGHGSLKPSGNLRSCLSTMDLVQYSRWLELIRHHTVSALELASSDGKMSDFDSALKTVSVYLDRWADPGLWDVVSKLLEVIEWRSYANELEEIRRQAVSGITAPRPQEIEISSNEHPGIWRRDVKDGISLQVEELVRRLMDAIDLLGHPGLDGKAMRLGEFRLAETGGRLRGAVEAISGSWDAAETQAKENECFTEWTAFGSHLWYMQDSRAEYKDIMGRCIQRQVLKGLYTRTEPREFLIC